MPRTTLLRPDPVEAPTRNPLLLPLVIVSNIAVIEAIVVVVLISAGGSRDPAPAAPTSAEPAGAAAAAAAAQPTRVSPSNGSPTTTITLVARGTVGRKVRSAGFAMTVEKIVREPTNKELANIPNDKRYLALLVAVENNTGGNDTIYPSQFVLKDAQGFQYGRLDLPLIAQALEWRSMGNRETVRGYVDFTVPANAKGLTLIYPRDPQPIHIDLDE